MRDVLRLHPDCEASSGMKVEVEAARNGPARLMLHYRLTGDLAALVIPPVTVSTRGETLWEHCCFEAFVRPSPGPAYYELNFAPSTQWAAYRFDDYRSGMAAASLPAPRLRAESGQGAFELEAQVDLAGLAGVIADRTWRLGLSVVLEEKSGRKSYWALAHPSGQPDFHHEDCFALELPPAKRS